MLPNNYDALSVMSSGRTNMSNMSNMTNMSNLTNMSNMSNMEMNRLNRRLNKSQQEETFTCSQQSILSAMDRFVKSVNNMDSTVLIPSRLRDMDIPSNKLQRIPTALTDTDLHSFYLMLNDVKKELLWGTGIPSTNGMSGASLVPMSGRSSPRELKHVRQPSDDSLGSLESTASSSSDQDTDSESADSMITDRDSIDEHTSTWPLPFAFIFKDSIRFSISWQILLTISRLDIKKRWTRPHSKPTSVIRYPNNT